MKKLVSIVIAFLFICGISGCKKKGVVSFCEGVDTSGSGVNCGTVFTTGDLTAVFNAKSPFGTDTLEMKIFNDKDGSRKASLEKTVTVNSDNTTGKADLEIYDEGTFHVVLQKHGGEIVSEGTVEIADTYTKP